MTEIAMGADAPLKAPWHLWVVGVLALLWNVAGAWTVLAAQAGAPLDMDAAERAYYAAQEPWIVAVTDVALVSAILAAVALLLRSLWAAHLFWLSIAAIAITDGYEMAQGTAQVLQGQDWMILTGVIWALAIAQLAYAIAMRRRGVLR
jgi:hypothetical protein